MGPEESIERAIPVTGQMHRLGPLRVPEDVWRLMERLHRSGHWVWLVGGAVRDALLGKPPHDWDLATDAGIQRVTALFARVVPVGLRHGTVQVLTGERAVEVTAVGPEGAAGLAVDLARRDFTVNAMAVAYPDGLLHDPHNGRKDLAARRLRAVGTARDRFLDDPLRVLRLARLVAQLGFRVERGTLRAAAGESLRLRQVAVERIRDEMLKMLVGEEIRAGFAVCRRTGAMRQVLPELLEGVRRKQNSFHRFDIYRHIVETVAAAPRRERVRLAALLHDIAKPRVRFRRGGVFHFYGHENRSAEMAGEILRRWRLPEKTVAQVQILVRNHMLSGTERWGDAAIRRLIARTGPELIPDLLDLARADCSTHTQADELVREFDRLEHRIREQLENKVPLAVSDLAIDGREVMTALDLKPGPAVGRILQAARAWVLEDPQNNRRDQLLAWIKAQGSPR